MKRVLVLRVLGFRVLVFRVLGLSFPGLSFPDTQTIGVTKMRRNSVEISYRAKFLQKALKSQEFRRNSFALLLHNTVSQCKTNLEKDLAQLGGFF